MPPAFVSNGTMQSLVGDLPTSGDAYTSTALWDPITDTVDWSSLSISPDDVWRTQPSFRKVVDFAARAIASTPLKVYRRVSDTDRQRVTRHPLVTTLRRPSPEDPVPMRFWHSVIVDWLTYDRYCVAKVPSAVDGRVLDLARIQASRIRLDSDGLGRVARVVVDGDARKKLLPPEILVDHGYAPRGANGVSPAVTLAAILEESREAVAYRRALWKNGARVGAAVERPAGARWSDEVRARFMTLMSNWARGGGREGSVPLLEDGMKLVKVEAFSPRDTNDVEGRQLTDAEVASAFHIAPELVGAREGTFSNVQAYRQQLYRDGLGPMFVMLEQVLNAMLVPAFDDVEDLYVEYDLDSKLRGSWEEQAAIMSTAIGAPWLTRNEGRARQNLAEIEGGDELVTPLNVLVGGQASPRDSAPKTAHLEHRTAAAGVRLKAAARTRDVWAAAYTREAAAFFAEQETAVLDAVGGKAAGDPLGDLDGWVTNLAQRFFRVNVEAAAAAAQLAIEALGLTADDYDEARTLAWLKEQGRAVSAAINDVTRRQVENALTADDRGEALRLVFDVAKSSRAEQVGRTQATGIDGFARTEVARQNSSSAQKRWVTGSNPRKSHARLDGETVAVDDTFSNGARWPGDHLLSEDERAGCNCEMDIEPAGSGGAA